ncbi:hypothetical protein MD484_g4498, partial [Candolleomyces efflorescens]
MMGVQAPTADSSLPPTKTTHHFNISLLTLIGMSIGTNTALSASCGSSDHNGCDPNTPPTSPTSPTSVDTTDTVCASKLKETAAATSPTDALIIKKEPPPLSDPLEVETATTLRAESDVPSNATQVASKSDATPTFDSSAPSKDTKANKDDTAAVDSMICKQKKWVARDLTRHGRDYTEEARIPSDFQEVATDVRIQKFLEKSPIYDEDTQLWVGFEETTQLLAEGADLRDVMSNIITAILEGWGMTLSGRRKLRKTHDLKLLHETKFSCGHSSPDFVIEACGPSFQLPEHGDLGFSNITTCITIDAPGSGSCFKDIFERHAVFARQIFAHQPNRRFVRTCCIDQEGTAWYHFDRSGLYENFAGFYNEDPHKFIRLILGLGSLDMKDSCSKPEPVGFED